MKGDLTDFGNTKPYQDAMNLALKAPGDMKFATSAGAKAFRFMCYRVRKLDRLNNWVTYQMGEDLHGASVWDVLRLQVKDSVLKISRREMPLKERTNDQDQ